MKKCFFTYIILSLNSALDTGLYDDIPMSEASHHIEVGDVIPWLKETVPDMDLSLLSEDNIERYHAALADIYWAYVGKERRKWGVEKRALCLLIAWTNELVQRGWYAPDLLQVDCLN